MLSSVFNRRKVQQRINNLTGHGNTRQPRPQSPPSPASFESPEIVDINDKAGAPSHIQQSSEPGPPRGISPQVQLNLRRSGSVSDWFPSDLFAGQTIAPPERGASLGLASASAAGSQRSLPSRLRSASNAREPFAISPDEVIVIEAEPRPADADDDQPFPEPQEAQSEVNPSPPRKAAPTPIIIPDNPAALKVTLQRSASESGPHSNSGEASAGPSRPLSAYSDVSSAVSGTTIARALVANSFIVTNGSRKSEFRGVTRQDSATLPKGEHPFLTSPYWRDKRISNGEIVAYDAALESPVPPVPPITSPEFVAALDSAGRGRRNSASVAEARRQSEARLNGIFPSDGTAPPRWQRKGSLTRLQKEQMMGRRVSTISEASSQPSPMTPATNGVNSSPVMHLSRTSLNSSSTSKHQSDASMSSVRHPSSSSTSLHHDDAASSHKHHSASSAHSSARPSSSHAPPAADPVHFPSPPDPSEASTSPSYFSPQPQHPHPSPSVTATGSSIYSPGSTRTGTSKTTDPTSLASPGSSTGLSPNSFTMYRSNSDSGSSRATPSRPMITVPVGERPHSVPVSASPLSATMNDQLKPLRPSAVPVSARLPSDSPMDSPDWLDVMVPESALIMNHSTSIRRSGSHLPPITVPSGDEDVFSSEHSFSTDSPSSESAARQTFPETPYAFSPLVSAGFAPQGYPSHMKNSPRTASLHGRGVPVRGRGTPSRQLFRSVTSGKAYQRTPDTAESVKPEGFPATPSMLSAIEESIPSTPTSQVSHADSSPERHTPEAKSVASPDSKYTVLSPAFSDASVSTDLSGSQPSPTPVVVVPFTASPESSQPQSRRSSTHRQDSLEASPSSIPAKRPLTPSRSPLSSSHDLPPPSPRPSQQSHSDINAILAVSPKDSVEHGTIPLPAYNEEAAPIPSSPPPYRDGSVTSLDSTPTKRLARSRPAPPSGPRRPSAPTMLLAATRARNGSIASVHSDSSRQPGSSFSATHPRFQTTPIRFRGLTMEQAQWTLSSKDLQSVVSKAIKQWADPASIRLLPPEMAFEQIADEQLKLEIHSAELRTNYKLVVRKRRALLASLSNAMDAGEFQDQAALIRTSEELKEISDTLDRISEELYSTTDQLMQLKHLEDVHGSSALGMALRKLNTSFIKHMQDNAALRQRISELEAERDEGWSQAELVAMELQAMDPGSRRASRVGIARKTSIRTSKAGLRSPSRHRSQRSSGQNSARNSLVSPALRSASEDIPPVPPIPSRKSLGIITSDLPLLSAGLLSEGTPTSEHLAMQDAQRELCEMLGISLEELQVGGPLRRRLSTSDVAGSSSPTRTRRNSDLVVITPAMSKDEQRAAVLASIGMIPHEI
ncbi:hypothetical protein EIP91_004279 [Steccherinum ochraceum]|uniref:Uncharacterized protein n=1 Tax=Steccherinum ochraceum TaxID=92696 RepID=A0A4R0R946_9APHY|nr:hypothetical protein EIP91_004279 [Steccherinum ochraceum]